MTRRTMAERKRRASERDARRESLLVLLSRTRPGVALTPSEAALMFAHVEVELAEADDLRRTVAGQQNAIQAAHDRTAAAEAAIVEAEQRAEQAEEHLAAYVDIFGPDAPNDFHLMQHRAKQAEATLERVRALAHRMRAGSPQGAAAIYADRIEQTLANDPDALTPEQTAVHAAFAEAADSTKARLAEQAREHAIALAISRRNVVEAAREARAQRHRADRYRTAWFAARRDRKADRAAMAAELPLVQAGQQALALAAERCEPRTVGSDHPVSDLLAALKSSRPHPAPSALVRRYYEAIHADACPRSHRA
ncbi:hypothetical protein [Streptomyces sp. NPDC007074]|uniref:hypothetical protein n=1 Tax=Streptomyces sp. NPDC007074 TaxID=3156764 RepID=UPI0033F0EC95